MIRKPFNLLNYVKKYCDVSYFLWFWLSFVEYIQTCYGQMGLGGCSSLSARDGHRMGEDSYVYAIRRHRRKVRTEVRVWGGGGVSSRAPRGTLWSRCYGVREPSWFAWTWGRGDVQIQFSLVDEIKRRVCHWGLLARKFGLIGNERLAIDDKNISVDF